MLDEVVSRLETGNLSLSDGLDFYEMGVKLSERAERLLTDAELRVSQLSFDVTEEDEATGAELDEGAGFDVDESLDETPF